MNDAAPDRNVPEILALRRRHVGPSLSVAYDRPLKIVRGSGQYLFDHEGRRYLDLVNNVCHVGHAHPRVVEAAAAQMALLNTNTRYLHDNLVEYARRLTALFPAPLDVCYLVCSGSEANDLALRMARTFTGGRDAVVVDGAYHGNLSSLIDLSPYKHAGPGGAGAPEWVHAVEMPDAYRGRHREPATAGPRYAEGVAAAVRRATGAGRRLAAFFCESMLSCGGQIPLPPGYLPGAFAAVRAAGGVCVSDEVQVGFGRIGTHYWAFEPHGVVPDIVTLGKPIGNGHPMGAVVTTRAVADAFANGMEYFNTFGGNPVSCAVGLAVLDVIEEEGLLENARRVGGRLTEGLQALQERHAIVGDVRGAGLFLGVDLVLDRETREPATDRAREIVNRMRDLGVLLSTDGPGDNVLKIKPPMVIAEADAGDFLDRLDAVLSETSRRMAVPS